jgi:DNA-binding MarR family transcriptional regulator
MTSQRTAAQSPGPWVPPLTVSIPGLLNDGKDDKFREFIQNWNTLASHQQRMREIIATMGGLTAPRYAILMNVSQMQQADGVSVRAVAAALNVTAPFVVTEVQQLISSGLLEKHRNPRDKRGVLLNLSPKGRAALERLAPKLRIINDAVFGSLSPRDFLMLSRVCAVLVQDIEATLRIAQSMQREASNL